MVICGWTPLSLPLRKSFKTSSGTTPCVATLCLPDITACDQISQAFCICILQAKNTGGGNGLGNLLLHHSCVYVMQYRNERGHLTCQVKMPYARPVEHLHLFVYMVYMACRPATNIWQLTLPWMSQ